MDETWAYTIAIFIRRAPSPNLTSYLIITYVQFSLKENMSFYFPIAIFHN